MRNAARLTLLLAGAAVAVALYFALRPGDGAETAAPTQPATTAETETEADETETETETEAEAEPPDPGPVTIAILIRNGRVEGGIARVTIDRGDRVRLVVRADVADHVHLHGYEVMRNVGPGRPAQLVFEATIPGRFEVELEDRRLPIAEIQVQP